jgi:hypothetical protein
MLAKVEASDCQASSQEQSMLVSDIERVEPPKDIIPSLVWFGLEDVIHSLTPRATYFSAKEGIVVRGSRSMIEYRESCLSGNGMPIGHGQSANGIIERSPEILQDVSGQQHDIGRDNPILRHMVLYLSALRITLYRDAVRLRLATGRIDKFIQRDIKITDSLLGPLDLCFGIVHSPPF